MSDAVHLLAYIEIFPDDDLSSRTIARSIVTNPSMVRSLMMDLRKSTTCCTLMKTRSKSECPVGGNIQGPLAKAYAEVEEAAFAKMREISLREIVDQIKEEGQLA
ncbi:transcriptional regulator [Lactobacillus delbrueckii subsp. bulgaricus]